MCGCNLVTPSLPAAAPNKIRSGSLATSAGLAPGRHCSPGALTCAKLGRFVQGDASELSRRKMKSYPALRARSTRHYNSAEEVASSVIWWNVESS